jgi:sulfite reductase alpha subunit-like flavoprotein
MAMNGIAHERTALIAYGTETGTSQDLAEEIGRLLGRLRFSTNIAELDVCSASELCQYTFTVFVLSTTGQGDFPSNARKFWNSLLRKKLSPSFLKGVQFALIGLGDSSYLKFNWSARKLEKRLNQLGAEELLEACEADEQGDDGTDGAFLAWSEQLRSMLLSKFPLPNGLTQIPDNVQLPSKWHLTPCPDQPTQNRDVVNSESEAMSNVVDHDNRPIPESFSARLASNVRVTPLNHWQDVRFIKLNVPEYIEYFPGDSISILPKNSQTDAQALIDLMDWRDVADIPLEFNMSFHVGDMAKYGVPPIAILHQKRGFTLRGLLVGYLDIKAIPRRSFFAAIAPHTNNDVHRDRLLEFTNPEYLDEYYDYATRPRRSILEVLQEFDSVKIPYQEAANVIPTMRPRQFSIASGGELKHFGGGTTFELLVAIVKYRTVIKRIREGVCTRYLAALENGSTLNLVLKREGRFYEKGAQMPRDHILIGPGTGVAPLRSLLYEMQLLGQNRQTPFSTMLIFGSRNSKADYFFRDEWEELLGTESNLHGSSLQVITAFSRDQKAKVYVQDRIKEYADTIRQLLVERNAVVIVSGSSGQMPKAVRQALLDVLTSQAVPPGKIVWTNEEAEEFLTGMGKNGRYKQETW